MEDSFDPKPGGAGKFFLGLLLGVALGAGGVFAWTQLKTPPEAPSIATMGPSSITASKTKKKTKKQTAGNKAPNTPANTADPGAPAPTAQPTEEPIPQLTADDLKQEAEGDILRPRPLSIDVDSTGPEPRDLSSDEVDNTFAAVKPQIVECIKQARGAAPVTGKIVVGVVIGPEGKVFKSRTEAPSYLIDRDLHPCIKSVLSSLRFPAPGKDVVASVPFTLR